METHKTPQHLPLDHDQSSRLCIVVDPVALLVWVPHHNGLALAHCCSPFLSCMAFVALAGTPVREVAPSDCSRISAFSSCLWFGCGTCEGETLPEVEGAEKSISRGNSSSKGSNSRCK